MEDADDDSSATGQRTLSPKSDNGTQPTPYGSNIFGNVAWPLESNFNPNWLPLTWAGSNYWNLKTAAANPVTARVLEELGENAPASSLAFQAASHQLFNGLFWDSFALKALDGTSIQPFNNVHPSDIEKKATNLSVVSSPGFDKTTRDCFGSLGENLLFRPVSLTSPRSSRCRGEKRPIPEDLKDSRYYERRKRNNLAAKKSRDARKAREDEVAIRACFLEKENAVLRAQVGTLREEAQALRQLLIIQKKTNPFSQSRRSVGEHDVSA